MAVSSVTNRVAYQGNGTSAVFAFGYELHSPSDLALFLFNSSLTTPGIILPMTLNDSGGFGYTFAGTQDSKGIYPSGGFVTLNSAPNAQSVLTIFRSSAVIADFLQAAFGAVSGPALTSAINRLCLQMQRQQDLNTRSVRVPDGFPLAFDPTLPENLYQSAGKRLIVNSSATGWTFDETLGSYTPNTLVIADTNSSVTSMGGAPDGRVLLSRGSSAPEWGHVNLGSSETVHWGTASGQLNQFGLLYACTAIQVGFIPDGATGSILTFNSGSFPTFQAFGAANINSGILSVAVGGTGTGTSYIQHGVVFASSATQFANTAAGGSDIPLIGNGAAAPSFRELNLSSGSSVTGILPVARGGTNQSTLNPQGVLFASSATQVGVVPSGPAGYALMSQGSSAPSFQPVAVTNTILVSSAAITLTNATNTLKIFGTHHSVGLYDAVGNEGRKIAFLHTGTSFLQQYTIVASSAQLIGVHGTTVKLHTYGQFLELTSNGVSWDVTSSVTDTPWRDFPVLDAGTLITGHNNNSPVYGTGHVIYARWCRSSNRMRVQFSYNHGNAGTDGSNAMYLFNVPSGAIIDTNVVPGATGSSFQIANFKSAVGHCLISDEVNGAGAGIVAVHDSLRLKFAFVNNEVASGQAAGNFWQDGNYGDFAAATMGVAAYMDIPMFEWLP